MAVFFKRGATCTRTAHPLCSGPIRLLDFNTPTTDGVATEPSDLDQSRDATVPPLECKQSYKAPPVLFIQTCHHTLDRLVLFGHGTIGVLLT